MSLTLAFGVAFQLPGDPDAARPHRRRQFAQGLKDKRRYFIVGAFVLAAVLTPPDVISQISLALPLMALYELAICGVKYRGKPKPATSARAPSPDRQEPI